MEGNYIPLSECVKGFVYLINSRNLGLGVFDGKGGFIGVREKFGDRYLFTEYHWDTGVPYGTVHPLEKLCQLPAEIPVSEDEHHCPESADWATDPITKLPRPSIRRDLRTGEAAHGTRQGFVDEWADTKERLPDKLYPYIRGNTKLKKWLEDFDAKLNKTQLNPNKPQYEYSRRNLGSDGMSTL